MDFFSAMKIKTRLGAGFGLLVMLMLAMTAVSMGRFISIGRRALV